MNRLLCYIYNKINRFYTGDIKDSYKNWNLLENESLYTTLISDNERLTYSSLIPQKVIFHCYWHGHFGAKQAFSIKSYLCTQNLLNTELWLWLDADNGYQQLETNKYLKKLKSYVKILSWDFHKEIKNTPFERIESSFFNKKPLAAKGDDFRIVALAKYGGLYFDLDVMFLKDFTPLLNGLEFVYAWEYQPYANSALLYLRKNSFVNKYIAAKYRRRRAGMPWVLFNYSDKKLSSLMNYPCTFFDPLWQGYIKGMPFKRFEDFFKPFTDYEREIDIISYKDFFPGAFTYHWHNCWSLPEYENSYFGIFNDEFDKILFR